MVRNTHETARLIAQKSGSPPSDVELTLRTIGYIHSVSNLQSTLHLAARLKTRWQALRQDLPLYVHVTDRLIAASELARYVEKPSIDKASLPRNQRPTLTGLYFDATAHALHHPPTEEELDLYSVFWLINAITRTYPTPAIHPLGLTVKPHLIRQYILDPHGGRIPEIGQGLINTGLNSWVGALIRLDAIVEDKIFPTPFSDLKSAIEHYASTPCEARLLLPSAPVTRPASVYLHERWLTSGHWHYPTPEQHAALKRYLDSTPTEHPLLPGFFESLIIGIAYATAKPIRAVLSLNFCGNGEGDNEFPSEYLTISLLAGYHSLYYRAEWSLVAAGQRVTLPLPQRVSDALSVLLKGQTKGQLADLLPPSPTDWNTRCEQRLSALLQCPPRRANLIVRDAMLRTAYHQSQDLAAVHWLSATRGESGIGRRPALTHYLNPRGARLVEVYRAAGKQLFGAFGSFDKDAYGKGHGTQAIPVTAHTNIAKQLAQRIGASKQSLHLTHNAFAEYTLTLLIAATGHRNSRTPFFFPWDFDFEHHLVFVSDKCTTGSEARFLPLAEIAEKQVQAYFRHLQILHDTKDPSLDHARPHIARLLNLGHRQPNENEEASVSLFFSLEEGGEPRTLGTRTLSNHTVEIAGIKAGRFRGALADHLWNQNCSGFEIAALLGHAEQNHPFGPASNWTTLEWAQKLRPLINQYLQERTWQVIPPPTGRGRPSHKHPAARTPRYPPGPSAYEGRQQDLAIARCKARKAIRQVLPDDFLADTSQTITDAIVQAIEAQARQILKEDDDACRSVRSELAALLAEFRHRGMRIASARMNLARIAECPVETQFSRHLALANRFRQRWIENVGEPLGGKLDSLERTAQLLISLIVFDGVLDTRRLRSLLSLINEGGPGITFVEDAITLRANQETAQFEFASSHIPGTLTSAQIIGILKARRGNHQNEHPEEAAVFTRIEKITERLLGRPQGRDRWSLEKLVQLFKPWWFLRLPGALYSIALGDHNGPAPHPHSEMSLYAKHEPLHHTLHIPAHNASAAPNAHDNEQKTALTAVARLIRTAFGDLTQGTAHTRAQRASIKHLDLDAMDERLAALSTEHPIIELVASFARDLVHRGGKRTGTLRFSSIRTYLSAVSESLIRHGWDLDFQSMDAADFEQLYAQVEDDCKDKQTHWFYALTLFHRFLRDSIDAPYVSRYTPYGIKARIRTAIATPAAIEQTLQLMKAHPSLPPTQRDLARSIILIGAGYGTRISECSGLQATHFDTHEPLNLRIQRNILRDLKTPAARRRIAFPLITGRQNGIVKTLRERAAQSPDDKHLLFATADRDTLIHPTSRIARHAIHCLRSVTANPALSTHDLRRTFATKITLLALPPKSDHPALTRARQRLLGDDKYTIETARELLDTPAGNPYLIDGIARVLGHADTNTLLDVYFVASSIALADIAYPNEQNVEIDDQRLANMLGRTRTSIVRMRQRIHRRTASTGVASIVRHYLNANFGENDAPGDNIKPPQALSNKAESTEIPWPIYDQLLCMRQRAHLSGKEFLIEASLLGIPQSIATAFLSHYLNTLAQTGFDDFEPEDSVLLAKAPRRSCGVQRGRKEREAQLERIQGLVFRNKAAQSLVAKNTGRWAERASPASPMLICTSLQELDETFEFLTMLDANPDQFEVFASSTCPHHLKEAAQRIFTTAPKIAGARISRGPKNLRAAEIGISIRQSAGSRIPDGRDLHRLLLVLACTIAAGTPGTSGESSTSPTNRIDFPE